MKVGELKDWLSEFNPDADVEYSIENPDIVMLNITFQGKPTGAMLVLKKKEQPATAAAEQDISWASLVPVGKKFQVKSRKWLHLSQLAHEGKIGFASIGYSAEYPISLSKGSFGSSSCCFSPSQLRQID